MAARARVVHELGLRGRRRGSSEDFANREKRGDRLEGGRNGRILYVLLATAVARLASDADLEEARSGQAIAGRLDGAVEKRRGFLPWVAREARARFSPDLGRDRARQGRGVGDRVTERVAPVEKRIDDLPLVAWRAWTREDAEETHEIRGRVVAEEARPVPDRAGGETRSLVNQYGVALVAKALLPDEIGHGQHHLVAVGEVPLG